MKIFFMKFWVVDMNQTREKLRSLNLHLTKKLEVARKKRVMLLVGELSLKEQEFVWNGVLSTLEATLLHMFLCFFCVKKFYLERELLKHVNLTN